MFIGHRNPHHLNRGQPGREGTGVMLGEDAEETLDRPEQRSVDQHRTLAATVGGGVFEFKSLRHVEVQLDGGHLPAAPQRVTHLYRDLGSVEGRATRVGNQRQSAGFGDFPKRLGGLLPHLVGADVFLGVLGGQLKKEVIEAVVAEQFQHEPQQGGQFVAHLLTGAVDMRVVLGHTAHAGQAVDDTGLLVAVHRAEFEEPQRKFPVGPAPRPVDQMVHGAVHRLEVVVLPGLTQCAVIGVLGVDVHGREHAFGVPLQVA